MFKENICLRIDIDKKVLNKDHDSKSFRNILDCFTFRHLEIIFDVEVHHVRLNRNSFLFEFFNVSIRNFCDISSNFIFLHVKLFLLKINAIRIFFIKDFVKHIMIISRFRKSALFKLLHLFFYTFMHLYYCFRFFFLEFVNKNHRSFYF